MAALGGYKYGDDLLCRIVKLSSDGGSYAVIGLKVGMTRSQVSGLMWRHGWRLTGQQKPQKTEIKLVEKVKGFL